LRRRRVVERSAVGKAVLQALHSVIRQFPDEEAPVQAGHSPGQNTRMRQAQDLGATQANVQMLFDGCLDSSTSVRRAAFAALDCLLQKCPASAPLQTVWLGALVAGPLRQLGHQPSKNGAGGGAAAGAASAAADEPEHVFLAQLVLN